MKVVLNYLVNVISKVILIYFVKIKTIWIKLDSPNLLEVSQFLMEEQLNSGLKLISLENKLQLLKQNPVLTLYHSNSCNCLPQAKLQLMFDLKLFINIIIKRKYK